MLGSVNTGLLPPFTALRMAAERGGTFIEIIGSVNKSINFVIFPHILLETCMQE